MKRGALWGDRPINTPLGYKTSARAWYAALALSAALFLTSVIGLIRDARTPVFTFAYGPRTMGGPIYIDSNRVAGAPGPVSGLSRGDLIKIVDGVAVHDYWSTEVQLRRKPPGSTIRLMVDRNGTLIPVDISSLPARHSLASRTVFNAAFLAMTWCLLLMIAARRSRDAAVLPLLVGGSAGLACFTIDHPAAGYEEPSVRFVWATIYFFVMLLQIPAFIHWTLLFPIVRTISRRVLALIYAPFACAFVAAVAFMAAFVKAGDLAPMFPLAYSLMGLAGLGTLIGCAVLVSTAYGGLAKVQRLQVKWLAAGVCVGFLPEIVFSIVPQVFFNRVNWIIPDRLCEMAYVAIPIGFAFSILQYRLFDVDLIVGGLVRYAVLAGLLIAVEHLFHVRYTFMWSGSAESWAVSALGVAGVGAITWRWFERPLGQSGVKRQDVAQRLHELAAECPDPESRLSQACELLVDQLRFRRGGVFLVDEGSGRCYCHRAANITTAVDDVQFAASGKLVTWVRAHPGPIRCKVHGRVIGLELIAANERARLERLDPTIIVPMRRESRLLGFWVFSDHVNGATPNTPMVHFLAELVAELAGHLSPGPDAASRSVRSDQSRPRPHVSAWFADQSTVSMGLSAGPVAGAPRAKVLGPYEIREQLGSGSFGTVWSAVHQRSERLVAVKALHPHLREDPELFIRFIEELAVMTAISDPNVVRVLDFGNEEGTPWLAMELVRGESLRQRLMRVGVLDVSESLRIGEGVANGLAACHQVGVIHRDLSPGNILLPEKRVCLVDFGLALRDGPRLGMDAGAEKRVAGTPLYMSPEHVQGDSLYPGSDLFALGSILYECLSGEAPFRGGAYPEVLDRIVTGDHKPLGERCPGLPRDVTVIVENLLTPRRAERPADARQVARQLRRARKKVGAPGGPSPAAGSFEAAR